MQNNEFVTKRPTGPIPTTVRPDFTTKRPTGIPTNVIPTTMSSQLRQQASEQETVSQPPIHDFTDPEVPSKRIKHEEDMRTLPQTQAYLILDHFIKELNQAVMGKRCSDLNETNLNPIIVKCIEILDTCEQLLDEYPTSNVQPGLSRYGNLAFRDWFGRICKESDGFMQSILSEQGQLSWKAKELSAYFKESFGNRTRIDYGTGHEAAFAAFMCCLARLNLVSKNDGFALVAKLFTRYLKLMRHVQLYYKLEPAGSHGVWGLDDYYFLPFLWGSSQLIGNDLGLKPSSIHDHTTIVSNENDYLYLAAIGFITQVKKGPFAEHSPMLNDIRYVLVLLNLTT
jgi:serine/threonine-protein phosphatase 2A activator